MQQKQWCRYDLGINCNKTNVPLRLGTQFATKSTAPLRFVHKLQQNQSAATTWGPYANKKNGAGTIWA